jgi:hypothetical protein
MAEAQTSVTTSDDTEVKELQTAFSKWDAEAVSLQRRQKRFAFCTALLGPVAVLLLTVQVLAFPHGGPMALTLISAEMAALCIALVFGFFQIGNPDIWMHCRLRAEILRREYFLVLARVGPYLDTKDASAKIKQRLVLIDNVNTDPVQSIPLEDPPGRSWRDSLEDTWNSSIETAAPDPECFDVFYKQRLLDQKGWFTGKSARFSRVDERFEEVAKGVLVLALVVSVWHLATLFYGDHAQSERTLSQLMIEVLAIVLPPVGSAATALQSLFEGRRLSRSYADRARGLTGVETALLSLHPEIANCDSQTSEDRKRCEFQLKRLVLRTEEILANELLQWWMLRHA